MKRSHLKRFSANTVHSPRKPNVIILREIKERVVSQRGGLPVLDNTFLQEIPRTRKLRGSYDFKDSSGKDIDPNDPVALNKVDADFTKFHKHPLRVRIDRLHLLWQEEYVEYKDHFLSRASANKQGIDTYHHIIWLEMPDHTLKLFFCGNRYCWVEEYETYARASSTYAGKERARAALRRYSKISWVIKFIPSK